MGYTTQHLRISAIEAKLDNPRFDLADNQRDAINKMVEDQQTKSGSNKLFNLAKNILEKGIIPVERIIVIPHEVDPKKYVVLEGNRRIICLKLLETPELIEESYPKLFKKFQLLSTDFKKRPIYEIDCLVVDTEEEARELIKIKHTGQNDGVGVVEWNAQQVSRFSGITNLAVQALDFLRNSPNLDDNFKNQLGKVKSSNLNRLLDDPDFRRGIGFEKTGDKLTAALEPQECERVLVKIVNDLSHKDFKVKEIYTKDNRREYLEEFKPEELPDTSKKTTPWSVDSPPISSPMPNSAPASAPTRRPRVNPSSIERKTLVPANCKLKIAEQKPNTIYHELRTLNINECPNSVGVMFRVFLELSVDCYISKHNIPLQNSNVSLTEKINKLIRHFESNGMMDYDQLLGIKMLAASRNDLFSITAFNKFVHNVNFQPIIQDLKTNWDNIQLFLQKIWDTY